MKETPDIPLCALVIFRDAATGRMLAGKVVGRTFEAEPRYNVRVGDMIHVEIAVERIARVSSVVVPLRRRLP